MIDYKSYSCEELSVTDERVIAREGIRFYDVRTTDAISVHGLYDYKNGERFMRMPEAVAESVSEGVAGLNYHTAGGRIRFATTAEYLAIRAFYPNYTMPGNMAPIGSAGFDVYIKKDSGYSYKSVIYPFNGPVMMPHSFGDGPCGVIGLPKGMTEVTINLPLHQSIDRLYIGLDSRAELIPHTDYKYSKPVLYYGSSITQGLAASRPGMAYEAQISRRLDCDFINLGFSGRCLAEPQMADYIATLDPSVFVYDYDHNATVKERYESTHEPLYLKFRAAHPKTPVIFVGRPDFWLKGYLNAPLGETNRDVLYATYKKALDRGENVYYIDGYSLFDGEDREECTSDGIHPNDLGMYRMGVNIARYIRLALDSAR